MKNNNKKAGRLSLEPIKFINKQGFTFIEILTVVFIIGIIALPFTNMFIFGVKGSNQNTDSVIASNLARDKIEEIKALPFFIIKSDYENFRDVFQDRAKYDDAYYNEDNFINYFSDVFSEESLKNSESSTTFKKLKELYPKCYLKELELYPNEYSKYRRVTQVKEISESAMPPKIKKITVSVFDDRNKKIAELSTLIGKHK